MVLTVIISCVVSNRTVEIFSLQNSLSLVGELSSRVSKIEKTMDIVTEIQTDTEAEITNSGVLEGKKIVYDGDSICLGYNANGGYPELIAKLTGCTYENYAAGGGRLCSNSQRHSVVDNLENLSKDADLYCFEGGINDYWDNTPIGEFDPDDYSGEYDTETICGALETIFTHCLEGYPGKPVCFVITHKIQKTATSKNANGDTFADYRNAMIGVCQKYSVPYYDAFSESGLNGWNETQNEHFLTGNSQNTADGCHPNEEGYARYYVPQLIDLFQKIMPVQEG
jgi:lysophospholipase L1-like esterase